MGLPEPQRKGQAGAWPVVMVHFCIQRRGSHHREIGPKVESFQWSLCELMLYGDGLMDMDAKNSDRHNSQKLPF